MEETICRVITELVEYSHSDNGTNPDSQAQHPLHEQLLLDLQLLADTAFDGNDPQSMDLLYEELYSRRLSPNTVIQPLASTMDSGGIHLSLLASKVYLSLFLSPNAPVLTLFSPMGFLSFLSSIRRCFKRSVLGRSDSEVSSSQGSHGGVNRKRKGIGGRGKANRKNVRNSQNDEDGGENVEIDVRVLFSVMEKLELVMGLIHLDRFPDSLKSLVQTLAEVPVLSLDFCANVATYNKLVNLCSRVLVHVLNPQHGEPRNTASEVLKSISPLILMPKSQARAFALSFIKNQMVGVAEQADGVKKAIVNLPRYLVQKAPEKSEPRALAVESIMEIVGVLELEDQIGFVDYVLKMAQGKSNLRLLAVDLMLTLVMSLKDPLGLNSETEGNNSWGLGCLEALIQRCSDVSAGIRARALSNLAQLVGFFSSNCRCQAVMKEVMGYGKMGDRHVEAKMYTILRKRCIDEKAAVRKAALVLVTKLAALLGGSVDAVVLKTMGMACSDPLVSIRKAAIGALSEAFRIFSDKAVMKEWLHSVLRLIADNESTIQEECENLFLELVLDRISRIACPDSSHGGSKHNSNVNEDNLDKELELAFPENILGLLREICDGEVSPWVVKICASLGKKKRLKPNIAIALENIIKTSESLWLIHSVPIEQWTAPPGAWFLLSEVSAYLPKAVNWQFLHHHWQILDKSAMEGDRNSSVQQGDELDEASIKYNSVAWSGDRVFLLQAISNVSVELPPEPAADLAHNLLKRIEEFNMHSTEVKAHVKALRKLCKRKALNLEEADALVLKWVEQVLLKASQILEKYISKCSEENKVDHLFTPPRSSNVRSRKSVVTSRLLSRATVAVYTIGSLVLVCPNVDVNAVIPLLYTIITSGKDDPKRNKLTGPKISLNQIAPLYIQAWLTMGKLCLADGKLAKNYIPLFVQELETTDSASLRNNIVVMMSDFCIRHTALVDCYITKITKCLRDPCELVRRQTFILLSRLLQRDYVKWRGVLFLRFLLPLVDESEKIRQLADFLFGNILKVKAPLLAYNSFVEAIFVLNDCHTHNGHSDFHVSGAEDRLFSIRGNDETSRSKRMHIYVSLLKQMAPEHLLATFAKLCAEILASASDGMLNIEDVSGQSVLQDTFHILSCKEIRISSIRTSSSESGDLEEDAGESGGQSAAAAKGRAITQAVRKGLIQNTIPIFIELKRLLESKNSSLVGSLMECLRVILKDYKNEIDDILVADKQLQRELIYDMQKYEAAKAKVTAAEAVANLKQTTTNRTPGVSNKTQTQNNANGENLQNDSRVASAMADAAAAATARTVLKEVNKGMLSPPLNSLSMPKVKSFGGDGKSGGVSKRDVLESLRRRQSFDSDSEI